MNADHYFTIGKPHITQGAPCEDYALSGQADAASWFAVVADGCGGAFANTDIGARALCFAFKKALSTGARPGTAEFVTELERAFRNNQFTGDLDDYLATVAGVFGDAVATTGYVFGDGAIGIAYANGSFELIEVEWWGNAPYYLAYRQDPVRHEQYLQEFGSGLLEPLCIRRTHFLSAPTSENQHGVHILSKETTWHPLDVAEHGLVFEFSPNIQQITAIAVLTDGISKIGDLTAPAALRELLAFKNHEGGFVKRRMTKGLEKLAKQGHAPRDDIAMSCLWFGAGN